jgi:hypothetical protein
MKTLTALIFTIVLFGCSENPVIDKPVIQDCSLKVVIEHTTGTDTLYIDNLQYENGTLWNEFSGINYSIEDIQSFNIIPE